MADVIVKNLTAMRLSIPAPLNVILGPPITGDTPPGPASALGYSVRVSNVDQSELNNSVAVQNLVKRGMIALEYVKDPSLVRLDDVAPTANIISTVTRIDGVPVTYLRRTREYTIHLDNNVQLNGIAKAELFIGGVLQESALNWPKTMTFVISPDTPLGLCVIKLLIDGRQVGDLGVLIQPPSGFVADH